MKALARSWLIPVSIAASLCALTDPAAAESDEGFFSRLLNRGKSELGVAPANKDPTVDCPEIRVPMGEASLRVGGQESASVRHQFSVGDVARECAVAGNQLTIKVGVKGRVVLGPAGTPGSYSAPLRIGVRAQKGEKMLVNKVFNVGATIAPGAARADFTVVTEPFAVPFTTEHAADDYEVVLGFGKDAKAAAAPGEKRKRRQARPEAAARQD
jgi:hypothetical protein